MRYLLFSFIVFINLLIFSNCTSNTPGDSDTDLPQDTLAIYYYNLQANGHFDEYIEAMHSCKGTTPEYKQHIKKLLQQHFKEILQTKKGVHHVKVVRAETNKQNNMANVFLNVTYNDSTQEEVMFPLVYVNNEWLIQ